MKIFIGICNSQEHTPSGFFWSFINIRSKWPTKAFRSIHPWDVIRNNVIIHTFLKSDCEILAKMDIDQAYHSDYLERLVPLCLEHKVVGPVIYDRWEQNNFMPLAFDMVNEGMFPTSIINLSGLSGVVEIPYPHTNLLYHREVLEKISPPWYEAYLSDDGLKRKNHVDFTFINKIHKAGYRVMIDLGCEVGHKMTKFVGRQDAYRI